MKLKDVKIGMKVVPHKKSAGWGNLKNWLSEEYRQAVIFFKQNGFLVVLNIDEDYEVSLGGTNQTFGDLFISSDFEPYDDFQEVEQKTEQEKIPFTVIMPL